MLETQITNVERNEAVYEVMKKIWEEVEAVHDFFDEDELTDFDKMVYEELKPYFDKD